jgi:hypothetical protein
MMQQTRELSMYIVQCRVLEFTHLLSSVLIYGTVQWFSTTGMTPWQTTLKCTADWPAPHTAGNKCRGMFVAFLE